MISLTDTSKIVVIICVGNQSNELFLIAYIYWYIFQRLSQGSHKHLRMRAFQPYTPWKSQATFGFLTFSGCIELQSAHS